MACRLLKNPLTLSLSKGSCGSTGSPRANPRFRNPQSAISTCLLCFALLAVSCAPEGRQAARQGDGTAQGQAVRKTLRLGLISGSEPTTGIALFGQSGTGPPEMTYSLHAGLTSYDGQGNLIPQLAQKVPTIDDGDWRSLPDGRMEVTWKLRPEARWHDGTPLTADDLAFGMQLIMDDELPIERARSVRLISRATATDPHTLVVDWSGPYMLANASGPVDIPPVPRHLVGDLYERGDKQAFTNSPYWTREFVGLGPYRLGDWEYGSHLEGQAFDQYFFGRAKIDRLIFRFFGDVNALVAGLLAGDVDVAPVGALKVNQLMTLKNAWEPSGAGTTLGVFSGTRNYRVQHRDQTSPLARDIRVRQALIHMLDRQTLVETLAFGLTTAADTLVGPDDPIYRLMEQRGLPKHPFDLARAQRLMGEAGWTRGADGMYRSASGELFNLEVRSTDKSDNVTEGQALAGQWQAAGVNAQSYAISDNASNKEELRSVFPGLMGFAHRNTLDVHAHLASSQISSAATRWRGSNFGGYSNPTYDRLYDQYIGTLDSAGRQILAADMLKIEADELASLHIYHDLATNNAAWRKGVRGPGPLSPYHTVNAWNIHTWELD